MRVSRALVVVLGLCLLGVGVTATGAGFKSPETATTLASNHVAGCAAEPPGDLTDPEGDTGDVVGWVDGYWYSEPVEVSGPTLTEAELDQLLARTAARVEALRCLTFGQLPPVEMQTRDEHRSEIESQFISELTPADRAFENARLATTLVAGQSVDAVELQLESQTAAPAAFYRIEADSIGFITDDPDSIELDEVNLAHELTHALQDQQFELESVFEQPTSDRFASSLAVVEGDATLVQNQYTQNCQADQAGTWVGSCISGSDGQAPDSPPPSWGLTLERLAAYNAPLVEETYNSSGWDGVNSLFEGYPRSTVETMYPDRYGEFEPTLPTVADRSNGAWDRITLENRSDDVLGQHTLTAILMAPVYETNGTTQIIDPDQFLVGPAGTEVDYGHPATDGWRGDRLYGYTDGSDTAGVWALAWENSDDAESFAEDFLDLAEYRGATPAEGYENVYTFTDSQEYNMTLGLERDGDRILVVTAPTVDELTNVHSTFEAVPTDNGTGADDRTDDGSGGADDGTGGDSKTSTETGTDSSGAGFGPAVVVLAALAGLLVGRRLER